jgi:hypothetical protein
VPGIGKARLLLVQGVVRGPDWDGKGAGCVYMDRVIPVMMIMRASLKGTGVGGKGIRD